MSAPRRTSFAVFVIAAALVAASPACSSKPEDFPDPDVPGHDANPDGVPYPTDHIGRAERVGKNPGDRIPNLTFQAYVDGDREKGLQTISLADYFDPEAKRHKVLDLQVGATWCSICSSEVDATVTVTEPLAKEGIVFLEVLINGATPSTGPSLDDVDGWVTSHHSNYTTAIDVRSRRMSSLGVSTVPWDILIDTRTMEILDSSAGAPSDVVKYSRDGLAWVNTHPPSY